MSTGRVCIITGANAGIGRAAAEQIAASGYHVILACRNEERAERAAREIVAANPDASVEPAVVDMGSMRSVRDFAARVVAARPTVDVLINNAAIFNVTQKQALKSDEGIELVWAVNHLGPVLLTELLLPALRRSKAGRVIAVSSKGLVAMPRLRVDTDDPEFDHRPFRVTRAYYQSKRAQLMYTWWLAARLAGEVSANAIRVTAVRVDLDRHPDISGFQRWLYSVKSKSALSAQEMARTYAWLATSDEVAGVTGAYFDERHRRVRDLAASYDAANIDAVMRLTSRYLPEIAEALRA